MSIDWTMLVATVVAFVLALIIQSVVQRQILATNARQYWNESVENSAKLVRQDTTGIIFAVGITNALLTAILATVIIVR
jgi:hypothetical protein